MKAIGKNVVIEKIEEEIKTESGLLLSNEDAQSFRYQKGKIISTIEQIKDYQSSRYLLSE